MLFDTTIRKELGRNFGVALIVLLTIVMTVVLIRTLGFATRGIVNPTEIVLFMLYTVVGLVPHLATLSMFIAMVACLTRMYQDSEMTIWFSSGQSLLSFLQPLLRFCLPITASIAVVAFLLWPWSNQQQFELRKNFAERSSIERVQAGQFQESPDGRYVVYIDQDRAGSTNILKNRRADNVFVAAATGDKETVISAPSARVERRDGAEVIILQGGQQVERNLQDNSLRVAEFQEYGITVGSDRSFSADSLPIVGESNQKLWSEARPEQRAELFFRFSLPVMCLILALFALAISYSNPRAGTSFNLFVAITVFMLYFNNLNLGVSWITRERIGAVAMFVLMHSTMLAVCILWLWMKNTNLLSLSLLKHGLQRLLPRRRT